MPLPFILAGLALSAAGYGVKKGLDAKEDFDTAKDVNKEAQRIYDVAVKKLTSARADTNSRLENLGEMKITLYGNLTMFANTFANIKNINFDHNIAKEIGVSVSKSSMLDLKTSVLEINTVLSGGIAALGTGGLAGLGAFGGVGLLASASTGTAISGLAGVAATNATLAWLGGGSLAAGGMGMAGGMAVLGGIVAGPVLAVGGLIMAAKAETAKHEAYSNHNNAKAYVAEMDTACTVLDAIRTQIKETSSVLLELNKIFVPYVNILGYIVKNSTSYPDYSNDDKQLVMLTASIAQTLKNVCDAPVLNQKGEIETASKDVLRRARDLIEDLETIK
jgi:hypothetical protein